MVLAVLFPTLPVFFLIIYNAAFLVRKTQGMGMSYTPRFTITNTITKDLTKIERARGFLEAAHLSEQWLAEMQNRALILEAHHTTHIEGTQLTLEQSELLLSGHEVAMVNPDDTQELLNYRDAFNLVAGYLGDGGPITEVLVREIHKQLVKNVRGGKAAPGEYRKIPNFVVNSKTKEVIYEPPSAGEVPRLMAELIEWINLEKDIHPVLAAAVAQFQLVHIHPYLDGNGRSARLLSTLCLYKDGYDFKRLFTISEYYDRDRPAYYKAIQGVRDNNMDMTGWLEYFTQGLAVQMKEICELGETVIRLDVLTKEHHLDARQKDIVEYLLVHETVQLKELEVYFPDVNRRSLQRSLKELTGSGIIIAEGATNMRFYRLRRQSNL